jgi:hypothetical protein
MEIEVVDENCRTRGEEPTMIRGFLLAGRKRG